VQQSAHNKIGTYLGWRVWLAIAVLLAAVAVAVPQASATQSRAIAIAASPTGIGTWVLHDNGRVEASGSAKWFGNGSADATAIAARPNGDGYWIVHSNGLVSAFGGAPELPDLDQLALVAEITTMAVSPSGNGYWLVGSDGGIFNFGDAPFLGSMGATRLNAPVVGIAPTASGNGYWLVASDGGIFSFGDAPFLGSMGATRLDAPIKTMVSSRASDGYMMIAADGGIFNFGSTTFLGSLGGQGRTDIEGVTPLADGSGYYMLASNGDVIGFGRAPSSAAGPATASVNIESAIAQEIFTRINNDRTLRGLTALRWDYELAVTATDWSRTMAVGSFEHSNLDDTLAGLSTYYLTAGENIYWGTAHMANSAAAHQSLMDSPSHRRTMLDTAYTTAAIGVVCVSGELFVTQQFGRPDTDGAPRSSGARPRLPQSNNAGVPSTSC